MVFKGLSLLFMLADSHSLWVNEPRRPEDGTDGPDFQPEILNVAPTNFVRAETDEMVFKIAQFIKQTDNSTDDGLNTFLHYRDLDSPFNPIVRQNRDTLYSILLVDAATGPLQLQLPPTDGYMTVFCFNQDHYEEIYSAAPALIHIKRQFIGSRYLFCIFRTLVKDESLESLREAHSLQDKLSLTAENPALARLDIPYYNQAQFAICRENLRVLFQMEEDSTGMFGPAYKVDPIMHLLGAAGGWGGMPRQYASYDQGVVKQNDGVQEYYINVPKNVPVNGFWSITVYDSAGYFFHRVESVNKNNFKCNPNPDGTITINFSNNPDKINNINIGPGWNYLVRLYEPDLSIISGLWEFPEPILVE